MFLLHRLFCMLQLGNLRIRALDILFFFVTFAFDIINNYL